MKRGRREGGERAALPPPTRHVHDAPWRVPPPQAGVGRFQLTTRRGRRAHSAATHLRRAARRPNLHVRCGCAATRLLLEAEGGGGGGGGGGKTRPWTGPAVTGQAGRRAVGVEYVDAAGVQRTASVGGGGGGGGGEVLLCAGAVSSPHLLLLSGIGSPDELAAHGIGAEVCLPGVGRNLIDQPAVVTGYTVTSPLSITDEMFWRRSGALSPRRVGEWLLRGSGPLASSGCDFGGFFSSRHKTRRERGREREREATRCAQMRPRCAEMRRDAPRCAEMRRDWGRSRLLHSAGGRSTDEPRAAPLHACVCEQAPCELRSIHCIMCVLCLRPGLAQPDLQLRFVPGLGAHRSP